jgi:acetyl esterase/lipase
MTRPRRQEVLLGLLTFAFVASACSGSRANPGADATSTSPTEVRTECGSAHTYVYAQHPGVAAGLNSLDVHIPPAGADGCRDRPVVVWVHGGGWTAGDKADDVADKVQLFNGAGYVFVSVNYRLTDRSRQPPSPQYPVHDQDVADAVAWIVNHATEIGGARDELALVGHSAGGGIVAAVATDARYLGEHGLGLRAVRCAAGLDGEGYDVTTGATASPPEVQAGYRAVFGDDPATWRTASPVEHVEPRAGIPPFFIAARGEDWRHAPQLAFVEALERAHVPTTVLDATALEHEDLSTELGAPGDNLLTPALMDFLRGCFAAEQR